MVLVGRCRTHTVTTTIAKCHKRLLSIVAAYKPRRVEVACRWAPELGRRMQVEERAMNEHPRLQHDWPFVCREHSLLLDDAQCRRYGWVKSVDLHDDCVEVRHLRVDGVEVKLIDSIDFSKQSC